MAGKNNFRLAPVALSCFFALLLQFIPTQVTAQMPNRRNPTGLIPIVLLPASHDPDAAANAAPLPLHKFAWHYHSGDNAAWANPGFDDSRWDTAKILFGDKNLPKGWTGLGWFRIWIKRSPQIASPAPANVPTASSWGIRINQDAASEIYWDGAKIASLGVVGHSRSTMRAERSPFTALPLAITDSFPHLLAVRFSNYNGYYADFIGFQVWISPMQHLNRQLMHDKERNDSLLISVAVQCTLALIHLFLFLFYHRRKLNLYFSVFVACNALAIYAKYLYAGTSVPAMQIVSDKLFFCATIAISVSGGILLYGVGYSKMPARRILALAVASTLFIGTVLLLDENSAPFRNGSLWMINNIFFCLVLVDGLFSLAKGIRHHRPGIWLIAIGMLITGVLSIVVGSDVFGWMHGNYQGIISTMAFVTLIMPVCFSIYLAMDFARINYALVQQEKEKNLLVTGQAEALERTVIQRTEELQLQTEKLKEIDAVKSRFFVNLTHEFKTPLTLIINPARELLRQPNNEVTQRYANFILQGSEKLLMLTDQLLDLSKLESGQMDIRLQALELIGWLRSHLEQYQPLTFQNQLTLDFRSRTAEAWIVTDPDKLEKIVQNLVSNALKFTSHHGTIQVIVEFEGLTADLTDNPGPPPTLDLHPASALTPDRSAVTDSRPSPNPDATRWFTLTVRDNGPGIPSHKLPYIFDRFYQADLSDTRTKEGTGIGLALTKELTELMGGTVTATSPPGFSPAGSSSNFPGPDQKGTMFTVRLPYSSTAPPAILAAPASEASASGATRILTSSPNSIPIPQAPASSPLILIVEDNDSLRSFLGQSLGDNYRVILANEGAAGLQSAFEHVPDLIITDLMMPVMDGFQLCTTLKTDVRTSHIPVIMLTAKTHQDSRITGLETGADAYLTKPFDKRELLLIIANTLLVRRQLRERYSKNNSWLSDPAAAQLPSIERLFLDKIQKAIADHLDDTGYTADQLGKDTGFSRTQLHRKLKELIGHSPGDLIRTVRLQRAHDLLQQKVATVAEVCYMVGYANPANFSTAFSRHFGFPPSDLLKQKS